MIGREAELQRILALVDDPAQGAVLLTGAVGVGKSRLAEGVMLTLEERGWRGFGLSATEGGGRIPYASLSELIPDALDQLEPGAGAGTPSAPAVGSVGSAELAVLRALENALALDQPSPVVLAIDDIASFDPASCELLVHLATNRRLFIVATQGADHALPEALRRLTPAAVVEIEIRPLSITGTATLAADLLEGAVGPGLVRALHTKTGGNPLFIRELVAHGRVTGAIAPRQGALRLTGELTLDPEVARRLIFRLGLMTPTEREVLELLALAESLGVDELDPVADIETLELMERRGLLATYTDQRRFRVRPAHPLHGEAIRADLTALGRRRRHRQLTTLAAAHGGRRVEDTVFRARAALAGGQPVDTGSLVAATYAALRLDRISHATELAAAAYESDPDDESRTAWCEALIRQGRFVEAEELMARPLPPDVPDWQVLRWAVRRSSNQLWGFDDPEEAWRIDEECLARLTEPDARDRVEAHLAWIEYCDGRAPAAVARTEPLVATEHPDVRYAVCAARAPALVLSGRVLDGAELAQRAWDSGWGADTEYGSHGQHLIALGFGLLYQGDLPGARFVAEQAIEFCRRNHETTALLFFLELAAWTESAAGQLTAALQHFEEARAIGTELAIGVAVRSALAGMAQVLAQLGRADEAAATLARLEDVTGAPGPRYGFEIEAAGAWVAAAAGDPADGARRLGTSAAAAAERGLVPLALQMMLDRARLGYATGADADLVGDLVARSGAQGTFLPLMAEAVRAVADRSGPDLDRSAAAFEERGCSLVAAELAAAAADAWAVAGDQRASTASQVAVERNRQEVPEARTTGLARARSVDPLTRREREIAGMAAGGARNNDIAERLRVSVRTVETHLNRIYRKLGVANRTELADVISPTDGA